MLRTQALDVWTSLFPVDPPFSTKLNYTYLREKINLVKFNFVEKGGSTGKKGGGSRHTYLRETN